ncbi:MAG: hypothetical protein WA840_14355 [Caulobacteraceae bacterium]
MPLVPRPTLKALAVLLPSALCLAPLSVSAHGDTRNSRSALLVGATVVSPCTIATASTDISNGAPPKVSCSRAEPYEVRRSVVDVPAAPAGVSPLPSAASAPASQLPAGAAKVRVTEITF